MNKTRQVLLTEHEFAALRAGNGGLFRRVFDQYCGLIQYVVGRCGILPDRRDDVVQDVFIKFLHSLPTIEGPDKIKAWLCTTARNRALDVLRYERRKASESLAVLTDENEVYGTMWRELELKLVAELVEKIGLEPGGRDFVSFYRDGKTAKEIAAANDEAVSTVTTRLSRLRRKFGEQIRQRINTLRQSALM